MDPVLSGSLCKHKVWSVEIFFIISKALTGYCRDLITDDVFPLYIMSMILGLNVMAANKT